MEQTRKRFLKVISFIVILPVIFMTSASSLYAKTPSPTPPLSEKEKTEKEALDNDLTRKLRVDLVTHEDLQSNPKYIRVVTVKRVVTLEGTVVSKKEKKKIERIAKKVIGVKKINNHLDVQK